MTSKRMKLLGLLALVGASVVLASLWAQDKKDAPLPADLERVSRDAVFFATIPVAEVWNNGSVKPLLEKMAKEAPDVLKEFEKAMGVAPEEIERLTIVMQDAAPSQGPLFLLKTTKGLDEAALQKRVGKLDKKKLNDKTVYVNDKRGAYCLLGDNVHAAGPESELQILLDREGKKSDGPLGPALKLATAKGKYVVGVNVSFIAKEIEMHGPPIPDAFKALLKGQLLLATADLGADEAKGEARLTFANAADAKAAEQSAKAGLELARAALPPLIEQLGKDAHMPKVVVEFLKSADTGLKEAKLSLKDSSIELSGGVKMDTKLLALGLAESVQKVREAASRAQSQNNLKQIGIAMHNYHDTYGNFPPAATYSKEGKPLLSWRVLILPYIEQDALYKEFKLDEPWDSEHNKKLLAKMPKTLQAPGAVNKFDTTYLAFVGKDTLFPGRKGMQITGITDGTSNTIMVAETAKGVPWTKPEDITVDNNKLLPRVGGLYSGGFNTAFCDGSVRFIRQTIDEDVLRKLITPQGGEVVGNDF